MQTIYLNIRSNYGTETVDEFTIDNGQSKRDFRKHVNEMNREYHKAGIDTYKSRRSTNDWKKN